MIKKLLLGLASAALVSGCSTLPKFEGPLYSDSKDPKAPEGPTVDAVIKHVQCEIKALLDSKDSKLDKFKAHHYVAAGQLTLEVTDTQSFNPSINVVEPFLAAGTSRVVVLGGSLAGTQRRTMNFSFVITLEANKPDKGSCRRNTDGSIVESDKDGIQRSFGIRDIVLSGLDSIDQMFFDFPDIKAVATNKPLNIPVRPAFGSTVEFTIARSVGGGPTFTLKYFRGPATTGNLLAGGKTSKDTLVIAFAGAGPDTNLQAGTVQNFQEKSTRPATGAPSAVEEAARNAQEQLQRMILQRLIPQ